MWRDDVGGHGDDRGHGGGGDDDDVGGHGDDRGDGGGGDEADAGGHGPGDEGGADERGGVFPPERRPIVQVAELHGGNGIFQMAPASSSLMKEVT